MTNLRIGQLARAAGSTEKTLRYYDQIGLLRPSGRSPSGYRLYGHEAVERLRFIRNAQGLGLSLTDIQHILDISDGGHAPCEHVLAVVERDLGEVDSQLKRLRELRRALLGAKKRLDEALVRGSVEAGRACQCLA
jgi:DNA-binding transcriptional MerR regulator